MPTSHHITRATRALIVLAVLLLASCSSPPAFEGDNIGGFPFAPKVEVQAFDRGEVLEVVLLNKSESRSLSINYERDTFKVTTKDGAEFSLAKGAVEDYPDGPIEPKSRQRFRLLMPKGLQGRVQDLATIACNLAGEETVVLRPKDPNRRPATAENWSGGGGTVYVRGYTRKDGTYVRPHTRSRPQ